MKNVKEAKLQSGGGRVLIGAVLTVNTSAGV